LYGFNKLLWIFFFFFFFNCIYIYYSQSQQYPFLNNFNNDHINNSLYNQTSQPLTEQAQALTEDTFPPSTVEKMNELYLNDKQSVVDQRLAFTFNH